MVDREWLNWPLTARQLPVKVYNIVTAETLHQVLIAQPVGPERNRIRAALDARSQTQQALATAIGLTPQAVSLLASGQNQPTLATAHAVAGFFGVPIEAIWPSLDDREVA
jgi:DNA-binding XRE family transcriptional regulator